MTRLWRLTEILRPHAGRFALATAALCMGSGIGLLYPQAVRYAVDRGVGEEALSELDQVAVGLLLLFLLQAGLTWGRHYLMSWLGQRAVAELRRKVFRRLLTLEPSWFHARSSGELVSRLSSDVTVLQGVVGSELSIALRNLISLVGGLALLFYENARLAFLMLVVVPPLAVIVVVLGRLIRRRSRAVQDRLAEASARVQEAVAAIETVQGFGREAHEGERYGVGVEAAFEAARRLSIWRGAFMATAGFAGFASITLIVWAGGRAVAAGEMTGGDLAAFMLYTTAVAFSVGSLAGLYASMARAAGATDRLFEIIDTQPRIASQAHPVALPHGRGDVRVENLSYAYPTRPETLVLRDISLHLRAGETVALVGRSGAGKSTLAKALPRFFDPDTGCVRLEGVDVRQLDLAELRTVIATVSQEPVLFRGTLRDNIAYACPDATDAEIERASRQASIHELAERLPSGWDTEVGERGVQLSGGQRQRVALARALLSDPRLLILDEATSHLDAENEAAIQGALDVLLRDRTALVIAHRLSTVRRADRILVLDEGRVLEEGTHEELLEQNGLYRRLVELQLLDDEENGRDAANVSSSMEAS